MSGIAPESAQESVAFGEIGFLGEFRELPRPSECLPRHQIGNTQFAITMLMHMKIEHPVDEGALKASPKTDENRESGAGDLRSTFKIEEPQRGTQLPMRARGKGMPLGLSPLTNVLILIGAALQHFFEWSVRDVEEDLSDTRVGSRDDLLQLVDLVGHNLHLSDGGGGVPARPLGLADLLRHVIAESSEIVSTTNSVPPARVEGEEFGNHLSTSRFPPPCERTPNTLGIGPDQLQIEHRLNAVG
jgi:hypothetical protein